jgi:hypothetical protein
MKGPTPNARTAKAATRVILPVFPIPPHLPMQAHGLLSVGLDDRKSAGSLAVSGEKNKPK